jgi:hypothetical protein
MSALYCGHKYPHLAERVLIHTRVSPKSRMTLPKRAERSTLADSDRRSIAQIAAIPAK